MKEDEKNMVAAAYALEQIRHAASVLKAVRIDGEIINLIMIGLAGARKQIKEEST